MSSTMTDSTNDKPTLRQNRLNPQAENFDFDLAEVQVIPDPVNEPSPLTHDGVANETEQHTIKIVDEAQKTNPENNSTSNSFVANESILQPAQTVPEIKTSFYVDYFDKRKQRKAVKPESVLAAESETTSSVDRNQDTMNLEKNSASSDEQTYTDNIQVEPPVDSHAPIVNGAGMAVAALSQFKSKQESINKQQEKLIQDFAEKIKKATSITYTAVFFGVVALVAATALGLILLKTKSEISDLAGTTTALEDNIKHISKAPSDDLEGTDPSLDQLNNVVEQLKQESEASTDDLHNEIATLQNKISHLEKTASGKLAVNASKIVDTHIPQTPVSVAEKKPVPEVGVKPVPVTKPVKTPVIEQIEPITVATVKPQSNSKTAIKLPNTVAKKESEIDKAISVPANDINNVINTANPQANSNSSPQPIANSNATSGNNAKSQANSGWTVNLASSNQLADAKKSAASYAQKGVPVTISTFTVKNQTRYRLQVKGFKSKDEAAAYANKAKDTLKLNSVWINP
jgi:gas vesicle protein